ncbi:Vegetative incompatibility protein HET-E-1 [Rhizoctonia solani]|uniref:Vegetative incompatibility protein HET-E-1 n=1 Tax=Rhizoctonia solani TaxID=456999 RepID=A0A8H8SU07_9AGAM|nr:Vegetative incompatibility protein HET-E-1 [Rhizoctonia solani]QRW18431.1 Vegetative incompatibility protein HET-E-1 [Rhizoctonia solani]
MAGSGQPPCCDPLQFFKNKRPESPSDLPADDPVPVGREPQAIVPMVNLAHTTPKLRPASKSTTSQSPAWQTFVTALKTLEAGVGIFPPLKEAVSGLLACTVHLNISERNRENYDRLAADLASLVQTLQTHLPGSEPARMPYSIQNISRAISEQTDFIKKQQDRSGLDKFVRASDDEISVVGCYRRIERIFRQLQIDISLSVWDLTHHQLVEMRLKELDTVHDARHNAGLSNEMYRRGCTPNTRVKILEDAMKWTKGPDAKKIYWMNGMAGTGKTTIAYTLCEQLEKSGQLGASFFCSRASPNCRNVVRIVPTIAYQLARFSNPYQNELCKVLSNNPDVARREISVQFEKLIVGPLLKVKHAIPTDVIVVTDALDECSNVQGTQLVLELLFRHAASIPVKFFVTSRPEPGISGKVLGPQNMYHFVLYLHDVEESLVQEDIRVYLEDELRSISAKPEDIRQLATRAGCLFIFAATVVRYIEPRDVSADHEKRLAAMLDSQFKAEGETYRELDKVYSMILLQALRDVKTEDERMRKTILQTVIGAEEQLSLHSLAELMGLESEQSVRRVLLPLSSVLRISADSGIVSTLHASFPDFMLAFERSGQFYCDIKEQNARMVSRCFTVMRSSLRFNICKLETSSRFDKDVPDLQVRADRAISTAVFYACRYWSSHLQGSIFSKEIVHMLREFLYHRLLFWMEVMNLKNCIGHCSDALLKAFKYMSAGDIFTELRAMIQDSRNFATTYAASPISNSTPHIYISALPLASTENRVRQVYWPRTKGLVRLEGSVFEGRRSAALATWATGSSVNKLALSQDGKRMVSGGDDGTISVWDVSTGRRILGPVKKHEGNVWEVKFSPDDTTIASGSADYTIYISNAYTGNTLVGPLEGHTKTICFLSFSPDGLFLASASEDHTIRIWNTITGAQVGSELTGHLEAVMCVLFSSNGDRLFSCSDDRTIRIWDWRAGTVVGKPLEGHTDWVDCIALSPDDMYVASSSRDCTVRIWNAERMETVVGPLIGHTDRVACVAYSSDGKRIVSGAFDRTIRVWSAETGDLIAGPFTGHGGNVYSVMFSIDDTQILSGSGDQTICVWDASHGATEANKTSEGHAGYILSVAVSPDGSRVVSGSSDGTICVWELQTGKLVLGPLKDHDHWVQSVIYTPDGTCIVSCSEDRTIRTWDAQTGLTANEPLTGHTDMILAVAVSPDSRLIASGSADYSVRLWNLQSRRPVGKPLDQHKSWVQSVDFSPDGLHVISGSSDRNVCAWNVADGTIVWASKQHAGMVAGVRFLPDGQKVVSCLDDGTLLLLDANTGVVASDPWKGHSNNVSDVAISPDGTMAASGSFDRTIGLWDVQTGILLAPLLQGHTHAVNSVAFSRNGKHIISGSHDGTVRVWNIETAIKMKNEAASNWVVKEDGWVIEAELGVVLWLPPDLASRLTVPPCSRIIDIRGPLLADLGNAIYGNGWESCYNASIE